jgi:hypothetical protein
MIPTQEPGKDALIEQARRLLSGSRDIQFGAAEHAFVIRDLLARVQELEAKNRELQEKLDNAWASYKHEIGVLEAERDQALKWADTHSAEVTRLDARVAELKGQLVDLMESETT